jgi:hypothetical protein
MDGKYEFYTQRPNNYRGYKELKEHKAPTSGTHTFFTRKSSQEEQNSLNGKNPDLCFLANKELVCLAEK